MNELQKSFIDNGSSFLMHYNHNHDKLGRFARSNGSGSSGSSGLDTSENEKKKKMSISDRFYNAVNKHSMKKYDKKLEKEAKSYGMTKETYKAMLEDAEMKNLSDQDQKLMSDRFHNLISDDEFNRKNLEIQSKISKRKRELINQDYKNKYKNDDYHFTGLTGKYTKNDVDLANYMYAHSGHNTDFWTDEEWDRANEILVDEEKRKR